ncbi:HAD family hydrolase [uncultured Metabacillus sp.]|uniref:HAD family hydrolase n=1 Tax=Metabacillus sp. Hm71 TaxID=3450743 RepID=UPI00261F9568|nr:HAD family hydrolase [uncultured Metabacillus sp.]
MNKIKGILFDKDGTLIDFHSIWVPVALDLVDQLLVKVAADKNDDLKRDLLKSIGVEEELISADGILASGTTRDITHAFEAILQKHGFVFRSSQSLYEWTTERLLASTRNHVENIQPAADLKSLLQGLTDRGVAIGIATADDYETTKICLEKLQVEQYFGFIGTSDRYEKKPNPFMLEAFCSQFQLMPEEVVMVGDTIVDILFAKNAAAGLAIGVLSGASKKEHLEPEADMILPSVRDLITVDGRLVWDTLTSESISVKNS